MSWQVRLMLSIHAVSGILLQDNKILIAERPQHKPYSGYWEFPGGKIEANETGEQALIRELHEELGITVQSPQFLFDHEYAYPDRIVHLQLWLVSHFSGEVHGRENQQVRWVSFEQMTNMNLLEGNWAIVDKIKDLLG